MNSRNIFAELKRRNVYKAAVTYAVVSWLLIQIATQVFPFFEIPNWVVRLVVVVLLLGFLPTLVLAWVFELTPEGIKRTEEVAPEKSIGAQTGRRLLVVAGVVAALALALFFFGSRSARWLKQETAPERPLLTKSIAVLPFENLSANQENAFFADGVQDEILTDLAKIADLKVISRGSVMQYRNAKTQNLRQVGRDLGVAHILEGSVQREGNRVRVSAQLIDARSDAHVWAERYDRDLADVFAIQSEIAEAIAAQLRAQLSPAEKAQVERRPTTDLAAYDLYLRAKELHADDTNAAHAKEGLPKMARFLEEAVARDPKFMLAYCLLAVAHGELYWQDIDHTPARRERASEAVQTALRLQPDSGEAHLALADFYYHGFRDYTRARAELEIARRSLPNNPKILEYAGYIDRRQGRWDESTRNLERALELDPRNPHTLLQLATSYHSLRRFDDERRMYQRTSAMYPNEHSTEVIAARIAFDSRADTKPLHEAIEAALLHRPNAAAEIYDYMLDCALAERDEPAARRALDAISSEGYTASANFTYPRPFIEGFVARSFGDEINARSAFDAARVIQEKLVREQPEFAGAWSVLGLIDAGLARRDEAVQEGRGACELLPVSQDAIEGPDLLTNLAVIFAWVGEKERALETLARAVAVPSDLSYGDLKLSPRWDPLRGDPRFDAIVATLAPHDEAN
ncbi:MAG: hypothetical protein M3Z22_05790 [Verrucomicrobiota bacterium]|nr:hypothetical protein [Verrucomicrobiota bacterium]